MNEIETVEKIYREIEKGICSLQKNIEKLPYQTALKEVYENLSTECISLDKQYEKVECATMELIGKIDSIEEEKAETEGTLSGGSEEEPQYITVVNTGDKISISK